VDERLDKVDRASQRGLALLEKVYSAGMPALHPLRLDQRFL
jgi:hypothetical protein